jgi:ABC-type lipopolysaccharide export system ATPase subunit
MMHTLEIDSVILEFGTKRVLQDVYLKCETGKITGILGRNGTGKTCLMDIIYGKIIPQDNSVRINEQALLRSTRLPSDLLYLPQFRFIPKSLSLNRIFEDFNLEFSEFIHVFPEFEKYDKSKLWALSGGEQRIVEIYLIISSETKFCLLDEPFSHVMPLHIDRIKNLILKEKIEILNSRINNNKAVPILPIAPFNHIVI